MRRTTALLPKSRVPPRRKTETRPAVALPVGEPAPIAAEILHELGEAKADLERQNETLRVTRANLTKIKRALSIADRERIRLRTILQMASDGIHIVNSDGVLVEANAAFLNMLGYDDTAIGKLHVMDWDGHGSWSDKKKRMNNLIGRRGKKVFTTLHRRRDGASIEVEVSASGIEIEGKGYLYSASRDIAEHKQHERMLQEKNIELENARKAAENANLAKSAFLSSMSHELRTPLNAVLGFAQLMDAGTPPPSAAQKTKIDQILKAGWHLLSLINEILDIAKIESGKVPISHDSMPLSNVLKECQAMVEPQAHERGIEVTFPDSDDALHVYGDPLAVKQVMINLLSNGIKYNRAGGAVIVQCTMQDESRLRVSVRDTGAGLAPGQLAQLFQPFNRLGQETGSEEGTGIGLVLAKQLVELMGGAIGVESTVGIGSSFWFELPASSAPKPVPEGISEIALDERDRKAEPELSFQRSLLYIEDDPANLALVEELIARRSDLQLMTAINGHLGIQMARDWKPDIILMDINLPTISGFDALAILRKDAATARIPVIALSARAMPHDVEKGLEAGFFRYLTKPIKVVEFMNALDTTLRYAAEKPDQLTDSTAELPETN